MRRNPLIVERAKELRKRQSAPEKHLWRYLNRRSCPYPVFRRQHLIVDRWIADFVCVEAKLVVEIDGFWSHWEKGDHDHIRQRQIEGAGYYVIRFAASRINEDAIEVANSIIELARYRIGEKPME